MASLILLIAGALLVTPQLFHDDNANAPGSLTSVNASIDLHSASPPPSPVVPRYVPRLLTRDALSSPSLPPPTRDASLPTGSDTHPGEPVSDSLPDRASDPVVDWLGQNPLAAQGIALPLSGCVDCDTTPRHVTKLSTANGPMFASGPGGSGGGFAPGPGSNTPGLVNPNTPTTPGSGPGDQGSTPADDGGNPGGPPPPTNPPGEPISPPGPNGPDGPRDPGDPTGPDPQPPEVVQVPEPSALVMAGMGALSFMIRARLARKRRG